MLQSKVLKTHNNNNNNSFYLHDHKKAFSIVKATYIQFAMILTAGFHGDSGLGKIEWSNTMMFMVN